MNSAPSMRESPTEIQVRKLGSTCSSPSKSKRARLVRPRLESPRSQDRCLLMWPGILSISMLATGKIALSVESGLMMRPSFYLMYAQTSLVTSVRGADFLPQIAANASLSFFGAKMPIPAFFMANAFFFPALLMFVLPWRFFSAVIFLRVAFVTVVFVVFAVTVFVVVVIAIKKEENAHTC